MWRSSWVITLLTAVCPSVANDQALALIRRWEGLRLWPYLCAAGRPTIGYGTTRYPDGRAVTLRDAPITPIYAAYLLERDVATVYAPAVARLCPGADTDNLRAALISFAYNLGVNALAGSTLRRKVNAQDWGGAKRELMRWVKAGGRNLPGLVARRAEEAALL